MLVDEVTIKLVAGHGGRGAVKFNKTKMMLGPVGGNGGKGGSIFLEGVSDISALAPYASRPVISAKKGVDGAGQRTDGAKAPDLILKVPVGTRVIKNETGEETEVLKVGEKILMAEGGVGGRGNYYFRSSVKTTPEKAEPGRAGEEVTVKLELRLIANVGLVGLPNAGKSSLLNELTAARSKIGSYPFTTLEPSLGVYYGLVMADIPGLIEGASEGKGLGVKFLKHIQRTKTLFHLVSANSEDVVRDYEIIRQELKQHSHELAKKKEYVWLTQADTVTPEKLDEQLERLREVAPEAEAISVIDDDSLKKIKKVLNELKEDEGIK